MVGTTWQIAMMPPLKAIGARLNVLHDPHNRYRRHHTKIVGILGVSASIPELRLGNLRGAREGHAMFRPRSFCRSIRFPLALLACSLPLAVCQHPLLAQDVAESWESQQYQETYLYSQPIDGGSLHPERYINVPEREHPWLVRFRTGASYFDTNANGSRVGGLYGIDAVVPIYRQLSGYAGGSANHFSQGSQYLGTFGLLKIANGYSCHHDARLGWGVLFDNFTDTRFNDPYLSQLRINLNYAIDENDTVGLTWYEPISSDDVTVAPGLTSPFFGSQVVEMYGSHMFDRASVAAAIGYRDQQHAVTLGSSGRLRLTDNVNALANAHWEDIGFWSGFVGVEVILGSRSSHSQQSRCCQFDGRDQREVVRGGFFFDKDDTKAGKVAYFINLLNYLAGRPGARPDDVVSTALIRDYLESNSLVVDYDPTDYSRNTNGPTMMGGGYTPPPEE